ncbi:MAG TPA: paraquat-inducible protein A [Casimicrobiaceae bacterium]
MTLIACSGCDLLQHLPPLSDGGRARCPRCGEILASAPRDPLDRPLALTIAAAIVFATANAAPLMQLSATGREVSTTLIGGAHEMWLQGHELIAAAVALCAVVAPASYIVLQLVVLLMIRRPPAPRWVAVALRWTALAHPWSMTEVLLLGILVALTKLSQLATVTPGLAMYAAGVLIVLLARIAIDVNPREYWQRVEWMSSPAAANDGLVPKLVPDRAR